MTEDGLDGESSADEGGDEDPVLTPRQGMDLCQQLERFCLQYMEVDGVDPNGLQSQLRKLCAHLRKADLDSQKQTTLDHFFNPTLSNSRP